MSDPNTLNFDSLEAAQLALEYKMPYCTRCGAKTRIYVEPVGYAGATGQADEHYIGRCSATQGFVARLTGKEREEVFHFNEDFGPLPPQP